LAINEDGNHYLVVISFGLTFFFCGSALFLLRAGAISLLRGWFSTLIFDDNLGQV
jgi:hypothetical protein